MPPGSSRPAVSYGPRAVPREGVTGSVPDVVRSGLWLTCAGGVALSAQTIHRSPSRQGCGAASPRVVAGRGAIGVGWGEMPDSDYRRPSPEQFLRRVEAE